MAEWRDVFSFTVPAGRVLYVEEIVVELDSTNRVFPAVLPSVPFNMTVTIDGAPDRWNQNIALTVTNPSIKTFIIVGQNQTITVKIDVEPFMTAFNNVQGHVLVRGDVLLVNKNPTPYTATLPRESRHETVYITDDHDERGQGHGRGRERDRVRHNR